MKTNTVHTAVLVNPRDLEEAEPFHLCADCAHGDPEVAITGDATDADAECLGCGVLAGCVGCSDTEAELCDDGYCAQCHHEAADWEATKASLNAWIVRGR